MKSTLRLFIWAACGLVVSILISGVTYSQTPPPDWYLLNAEKGGFSVRFPAQPKFETESMLGGAVTLNMYTAGIGNDFEFSLGYFDVQGATQDDTERSFETMAKFGFNGMKASIVSSQAIKVGTCSGREYSGTGSAGQTVRIRLFNSGQRYFMAMFIASTAASNVRAVSDYFFDSFKISDGCTGGFAPVEAPSGETTKENLNGVIDPVTGWRRLVVAKHEFEVLVPNPTEVESEQVSIKPIPITSTVYSSNDGNTSYILIVQGDYPDGLVTATNQRPAIDDLEQKFRAVLEKGSTKITLTRNMIIGGFPGREYNIVSDTRTGQAQLFLTKKRSYFFMMMSDKGNFNSVYANRFFGSIRISVR